MKFRWATGQSPGTQAVLEHGRGGVGRGWSETGQGCLPCAPGQISFPSAESSDQIQLSFPMSSRSPPWVGQREDPELSRAVGRGRCEAKVHVGGVIHLYGQHSRCSEWLSPLKHGTHSSPRGFLLIRAGLLGLTCRRVVQGL